MAFSYRRSLTIDDADVPGTLTDFPLLVAFTHNDLRTTANGGHVENASGHDIVFCAAGDGSSLLDWEIESYNAATGALVAWVRIPSLSSSADTVLYILYGDAGISTFQGDAAGVWDADYEGVYHLRTVSAAVNFGDSTSNGRNLSAASSAVAAGKIDGALDVGANANNASFGTHAFPATFSAWVKADANNTAALVGHSSGGNSGYRMGFAAQSAVCRLVYTRASIADHPFTSLDFAAGQWVYLVVRITSAGTTAKGWMGVAGTLTSQSLTVVATISGTPDSLYVGARDAANVAALNGDIDEVRFSTVERSDAWVATEYANQYDPGSFVAVGSEQFIGGTNYEESIDLDVTLTQTAVGVRGVPLAVSLTLDLAAAAAAHLNAAAPIALGLDLDAALSTRADLAEAIALDLDLDIASVGAGAVEESVSLGLSLAAAAAATVQLQAAVTLDLELDDGIRGGHLFGEAIALDLDLDQLAVMGFLYAEAAAMAMGFDVALATRMAASGTILLACSLACAQTSSSAYVASVALGLVLDYVPVSKIDAVDAITLDLELNAHAAVAHAFADAIALALEMDADAAARLGAVGIAALTFALEAEASAKLDAVASVSLGIELDQGHATKLDAVEAVALGAAFDLDLAGSGRGFSNAVALGVQVALVALAVRAGNDPGAFRPEPGGTPGIFRPPGSGATPGMLRPAGGNVRPDIFKREGS